MKTQFELHEPMTLCCAWLGGIINPFQPNVSSSGVFMDMGAELWGYVFKQRSIKDIRLFGEKGQGVKFFGFQSTCTYAAPTYLGSCILFFIFKCVFYLTLTLPLSLSLWGGFLHVYNSFFVGWREIKGKDENAYGQFSRAL